jgi:oligopeptide transport system permease protein
MLDVLEQDYIRTARAKGLPTGKVIFKHALRNALITAITYIGYIAAFILTGSLVVETVFNIPGLGRYFVQSIGNRDYPLIMGTTIILSIFVCAINFVVDVLYRIIDPRIQLTREAN